MSNNAINRMVSWLGKISGSEMLVGIALADFADGQNDDACSPSVKKVAENAAMSERQVRVVLSGMEKKGVIVRKNEFRKNDRGQTTNSYYINYNPQRKCPN